MVETQDRIGAAISPTLRARITAIQVARSIRPGSPTGGPTDSEMVRMGLELLCDQLEAEAEDVRHE